MTDAHIADACGEGEHALEWDRTTFVCIECDVSSQTLSDYLGHDLGPDMSVSESDTDVECEEEDTPDQATLAGFGEVKA